jgi:hypothetical protein
VIANPWHRLPDQPEYVLPEDKEQVLAFNQKKKKDHPHFLHLDLIPEPFVGRPDAPVLLLANNPGVSGDDTKHCKQKPKFTALMRENLLHRVNGDYPFLYLDPELDIAPASKKWWTRKLKRLLKDLGPDKDTARRILGQSILAVEFCPYPSQKYGFGRIALPSRQYSINLVRSAMAREAVIVLTRGHKRWLDAVEELNKYRRLVQLEEVQKAAITPKNCGGPEKYQQIIEAIKATLP